MKEGWGFATDGKVIFGSDGTSSLYEISPQNFKGCFDLFIFLPFHLVILLEIYPHNKYITYILIINITLNPYYIL